MDLWLLECDYKKLISKVAAKKKKSNGEAKKMYINHIIKESIQSIVMSIGGLELAGKTSAEFRNPRL